MAWNTEKPNELDELKRQLWEKSDKQFAFRGQADCDWELKSVFDRPRECEAVPKKPPVQNNYASLLERERVLLGDFAKRARRFLSGSERWIIDRYCCQPKGPSVWHVMAMGRHYGLATRALDWTSSVLVAAYFAANDKADKDGALWWFDKSKLERILHEGWDRWDVPKRRSDPRGERAIEERAFQENYEHSWVTQIYFPVPFPRMEAQRAFLTVCSRLGVNHCHAIECLSCKNQCNIERGKIVIPRDQKEALLDYLEGIGISAHGLLYPGADIVAQQINQSEFSHRSNAPVVAEASREGA